MYWSSLEDVDWGMLVKRGKTELILFNCEENDFELPYLNGDICQGKKTKSLGVIIDSKLNYREHSTKTIERAMRNWNIIKSLCNRKWSLAFPTLVLLYKTTILPSLFYAAPIWLEKNLKYVTAVQNNFIRTVFRHGFSPNIDSCQVLLGAPPLDLLSTAINVKFLLKLKLEDDLLHWTHDASSSFPDSVANLLESHVTRFGKFLRFRNCTRYKQRDISVSNRKFPDRTDTKRGVIIIDIRLDQFISRSSTRYCTRPSTFQYMLTT